MKCRWLHPTRSLFSLLLFISSTIVFGQPPANDNCSGAVDLIIYDSEVNAIRVEGDTRNTIDALNSGIPVCSNNFYRDDVWYKVTAPDISNLAGYVVKFYYSGPDAINGIGLATYASCNADTANIPILCTSAPLNDQVIICLGANETVYIRVWSNDGGAANWMTGQGVFEIAVYDNEPISDGGIINVLWGDEPGQGDFDGGLNDWTTEGISCAPDAAGNPVNGSNALWTWDRVGRGYFTFGGESVASINSRTFCNGSMIFDSGLFDLGFSGTGADATCPAFTHEGSLISPVIDISAFNVEAVSVIFNQNMQRSSEGLHFLDYSLDGGQSWMEILINDDYTYLSTDPSTGSGYFNEEKRVRLPGAEGSANLRIRLRFSGGYYWWVIDDVRIIESECNNLSANSFYALTPNAQWQINQLSDFGAFIDVENIGSCDQTNVVVDFEIRNDAGVIVVSGTKDYGTITVNELAENDLFDECFEFPSNITTGTYTASYIVRSDSTDFDPGNNTQSFDFMITNEVMAKDMPGEPLGSIFSTEFPNWRVGNGYHIVKGGEDCQLCEVEVGIGNASELAPNVIGAQARMVVRLYEYLGLDNGDGSIDLALEVIQVGFTEYEFTNFEVDGTIYRLPIYDENFEECVPLKDNTTYFLVAEYTEPPGTSGTQMHILSGTTRSYVATNYMYASSSSPDGGLDSPCQQYFGDVIDLDNTGKLNYYGTGFAPVVRMLLDCQVSTDPVVTPSSVAMTIIPNPVKDMIRVDMSFPQAMDRVVIRLTDMNGRMMMEETQSYAMGEATWSRDISHLANGAYFLSIVSASGVRTERFVVEQ